MSSTATLTNQHLEWIKNSLFHANFVYFTQICVYFMQIRRDDGSVLDLNWIKKFLCMWMEILRLEWVGKGEGGMMCDKIVNKKQLYI